MIEGKTPEEIRETFHIPDDLTEEEKLEPLRNMTDDPRITRLNRLYARKRKELKERERLKQKVEVEEERVDTRSVDYLLSFINGGDGDSKGVRASKTKKKNRRRKEQPRNSSSSGHGNHEKELNVLTSALQNGVAEDVFSQSKTSNMEDSTSATFSPNHDFDDTDIDDELDPAVKEQLDWEVEDFARRLNSVWPNRMQEILSLDQETRLVPFSMMNGNGSATRYTDGDSSRPLEITDESAQTSKFAAS